MKSLILLTIFLCIASTELSASEEMKRIDSIVNDITTLRKSYERKLVAQKEKNKNLEEQNRFYKKQIDDLKNQIKNPKKSKNRNKVIKKICKDDNEFPKLKIKNSLNYFDASVFRLDNDAIIYATPSSYNVVAKWEKGTSFTSYISSGTRVKITGYFVNRIWQKADKDMWIERHNIIKR